MSQNIRKKAEKTNRKNNIDGVMVNVLASSVVDCWFELESSQTKDYKICIFCFSAKRAQQKGI